MSLGPNRVTHYNRLIPFPLPFPFPVHANTGTVGRQPVLPKAHGDATSERYVTIKLSITYEKSPLTLSSLVPMPGYEAIYR